MRFHPDCYYRADADSPTESWPALIAAVTDLEGRVTGVLRDDDPAGDHAVATLMARTQEVGIDCLVLSLRLADFNDDLRYLGRGAMRAILHSQLAPQDVVRFLQPVAH